MRQPLPLLLLPLEHHSKKPSSTITESQVIELQLPSPTVEQVAHDDEPALCYQREASTVELFYDLFLVANLAIISEQRPIANAKTLEDYLGYFTILWFTWLQTILYDVRFATESIFHHLQKALSFAIIIGFGICRGFYDIEDSGGTVKGFAAMSYVLMASRLALAFQYGLVLFYVRHYPKWRLPVLYTACVLLLAAAGHLTIALVGTHFQDTYVFWYPICVAEAVGVLGIACKWRNLGFTKTHLVERLGMLTLIIIGEGILDITRTSYVLSATLTRLRTDYYAGLFCTLAMVYMIFVLYFGHIDHEKFSTVKQQIWLILHFPLHVAVLLTVTGSSTLSLAGVLRDLIAPWGSLYPGDVWNNDWSSYFNQFSTPSEVVSSVSHAIDHVFEGVFRDDATLAHAYNYTFDVSAIDDTRLQFNSPAWQQQAIQRIDNIWYGLEYAVYSSLGIHGHTTGHHTPTAIEKATSAKNVMNIVYLYYFFAAGGLLIVLAVMYPFAISREGNAQETRMAIVTRIAIGVAIMLPSMTYWIYTPASWTFYTSPWTTGSVVLPYLLVVLLDRVNYWFCHRKSPIDTTTSDTTTGQN